MKSVSSLCSLWQSSIGRKIIVAVTGLIFALFLVAHLIGNLLIFVGEEAFNQYAEFLHHLGHGAAIWISRIVLLVSLIIHVVFTIQLTRENRAARQPYQFDATVRASRSSKFMIWSGFTILAFIVFHILHFTVRTDSHLAKLGKENPWEMVVEGFTNPLVSLFYIIAMTLFACHLCHGVSSVFQTLGLRSAKTATPIAIISKIYSVVLWLGFISIPLAILFGFGR